MAIHTYFNENNEGFSLVDLPPYILMKHFCSIFSSQNTQNDVNRLETWFRKHSPGWMFMCLYVRACIKL